VKKTAALKKDSRLESKAQRLRIKTDVKEMLRIRLCTPELATLFVCDSIRSSFFEKLGQVNKKIHGMRFSKRVFVSPASVEF
jgi:hypothetical protein